MKTHTAIVLSLVSADALAEPFINLNFEEANRDVPPLFVHLDGQRDYPREAWLPGWRLFGGSIESRIVSVNKFWTATQDSTTLYDNEYLFKFPVQGELSFLGILATSEAAANSLIQTGDIPSEAKSLWYQAMNGAWEVRINGIKLEPYDPLEGEAGDKVFRDVGVDVSAWAGKNVELKLTQVASIEQGPPFYQGLDNIRFSAEVIPEPKQASLLVIGFAALWVLSRR